MSQREIHWSRDLTLSLIEQYENAACLWDTSSSSYHKRPARELALCQIAASMQLPLEEVRRKLQALRSQYCHELQKEESRQDSSFPYVSKWFAYPHMHFLREVTSAKSNALKNSNSSLLPLPVDNVGNEATRKRKAQSFSHKPAILPLPKRLSAIQVPPAQSAVRKAHDEFGLDVAESLRQMPDEMAALAKIKIQEILFNLKFRPSLSQSIANLASRESNSSNSSSEMSQVLVTTQHISNFSDNIPCHFQ